MSVKAVNQSLAGTKHNSLNNNKHNQQSFTGSFNPIVPVMDAIERGGFAASFIAQDGIGMVAPRISEGLNRNRPKDENGKKTGPLNWEFARREGIREILSGPSAFLIPLGILSVIKKTSGPANNVHVNHIEALGQNFADYAANNTDKLANGKEFKRGFYAQVFENALKNSTENLDEIAQKAQKFADDLVEVETLRANNKKKQAKNIYGKLVDEYMDIRKKHAAPSSSELGVIIDTNGNKLNSNIRCLTQSLTDYSNDALKHVQKHMSSNTTENIAEYIGKFNKHRAGTRVLSNLGMWGAVVSFYTLIPKLYNMGLKHDPGLTGLVNDSAEDKKQQGKDVAFTGNFAKIGETAMQKGKAGKLLGNFEFNGASMSVPAMLTLLFGFCLPPRYLNAKSDKERKEILVRDISSFGAILFGAKALSRGFSNLFAKTSGLALNIKPANHNGILNKVKNYFSAGEGIDVLTSEQIISKYSRIDQYKDGINGFFNFIQENGGNIKKVLKMDNKVKTNTESILKEFNNGKSLNESTIEEIQEAFQKARTQPNGSKPLEKIYERFTQKDNKFVTMAKTYNSAFGFASTLVLVPAFMIWLARYCEKMTKNAIAKEQAAQQQNNSVQNIETPKIQNIIATSKPSMAGFLHKS